MAPFLLIFTTVLVLISVHIMVLECTRTYCTGPECPRTSCPNSCACLGSLVDCTRRGLVDVPSDLPVWVQILDLSNNQLRFVDSAHFLSTPSLQQLIINHNHLTELPDFEDSPSLITLSLQHNEIHSLNCSILKGLPKLQNLDLSFNSLVDLPADTFGNSSSLLHLSLSHNRLVSLEKGVFDNLTALESLKLSKNRLDSIPKELFRRLGNLQHLELNSNNFSQIEGLSFQGLSSLVLLKIRHAGIRDLLDGSFYGLSSIRKLQLDYNNIRKITKGWLYGLNSLQRLYVNHNNISEIEDDAWDSGKRLLELDLSENNLNAVTTKTFDKLYTLKRLILSNNVISYIEDGAFKSLSALQYLELKSNKVSWTIEDTSRVFSGLSRLKYLGLADNGIRSLVKTSLSGLNRLEVLDLTHNEVTTFEEEAFNELLALQELSLNSSSLLCDCNLSWISHDFPFKVQAKCGYPDRLKGYSVFQVPTSAMLCEGSPKPVITKEPHTKITLKGENVTLECEARSPYNANILWRKDGKLLENITHRIQSRSYQLGNVTVLLSHFILPAIQDEDEGKYQCVVSNQFGSIYSGKARITVHVFPVFTKTPRDLSVRSGGTARLECGARGQPPPQIEWRKDGGGDDFPAARERRMHVMPTDDVFFITGVRHQDAGTYSCKAFNVAGTIYANATLTVLETPSFVKRMEDKEVRAGETAVLECLAAGSPRPRLSWSKDGGELLRTERHFFTAQDQLLIIVQSQPRDAGTYSCEMANTLGTERGSSRLKVIPVHPVDFRASVSEPTHTTTGVIVIAVVICIVGTSVVWVVIIYHTRKRTVAAGEYPSGRSPPPHQGRGHAPGPSCAGPPGHRKPSGRSLLVDSHSGHSKSSGQQSSDELLAEDYHELLLEKNHTQSRFGSLISSGSLLVQSAAGEHSSREQTPLLQPRCPHVSVHVQHHEELRCSRSAEQLQKTGAGAPPRTDSDGLDSGFSTFPRSVTLASVGQWSNESPRFRRLPKDVPNDSGSFSIVGYDTQEVSKQCRCTKLPLSSTRSCSAISGIMKT